MLDIGTNIECHYQPIFSLKRKEIFGYEALTRFRTADGLISYAEVMKEVPEELRLDVEWECRKRCISGYNMKGRKLFLNIDPNSILSPKFGKGITENLVREAGFEPSEVVIEITESERVRDIEVLKRTIEHYRERGFMIALDDFGTGYSTIDLLLELVGYIDFIKLPRQIIDGVSRSFIRYQLVETFREVAHSLGIEVIAEGVEKKEDLESLSSIGIDLVQGFLIAKPAPPEELRGMDITVPQETLRTPLNSVINGIDYLEGILKPLRILKLGKEAKFKDVAYLLERIDPSYYKEHYLLIDLEGVKYLLNIWEYARISTNPLKLNLIYNKQLSWFVSSFLKDQYPDLIREVSQELIAEREELTSVMGTILLFEKHRSDVLLVRERGKLRYYLNRNDLYEAFYRMFYVSRIHTNPLTGLPANLEIERTVEGMIASGEDFFLVYLDIDNFKPFNDTFGFYLGDVMIKKTAFLLNSFLKENFKGSYFLGHIGGDDFLFLIKDVEINELKTKLLQLVNELEANIKLLYPKAAQELCYFEGKDREGNLRKFPVASFSLVVVSGRGKRSLTELSGVSAELKKKAKAVRGSAIAVEGEEEVISSDSLTDS